MFLLSPKKIQNIGISSGKFSEHEKMVESLIFIKSGNIKKWTNIMNHEPQEAGMIL
jgi:hypothetical protein